MTKEILWQTYVDRNPKFLTGPINFTPDGLRKFFDQTFDIAEKSGKETPTKSNYDSVNMFRDMFSGEAFKKKT